MKIKNLLKRKDALKTALEGQDIEDIKSKKEELEKVIQELSAKVYEQAGSTATTSTRC
ncbi:hypothetical protein ACVQ92_01035 [Staphylococcus aureus]